MGYDVSYHPISPEQMRHWYVASLGSDEHAAAACEQAGMHELYRQKFLDYLPEFRVNVQDPAAIFDKTHAFYIAVTQGFFAPFHYVRGAMLSEVGDVLTPYTEPWAQVLPELVGQMPVHNRITENYSGGVYLPAAQVARLAADMQTNHGLRTALDQVFPGEHLGILWSAMQQAQERGLGLLEATDLIEPNPLDLESTHCLTNLFNCDTAGPMLYQRTAQAQLAQLGVSDNATLESIERVQITTDTETGEVSIDEPPSRTGFRARFRRN